MLGILSGVFGTRHDRERKRVQPIVDEINEYYSRLQGVSEEELRGQGGGGAPRRDERRARGAPAGSVRNGAGGVEASPWDPGAGDRAGDGLEHGPLRCA